MNYTETYRINNEFAEWMVSKFKYNPHKDTGSNYLYDCWILFIMEDGKAYRQEVVLLKSVFLAFCRKLTQRDCYGRKRN